MTKEYDVTSIEDYYVVVDKEAPLIGWVYFTESGKLRHFPIEQNGVKGLYYKVIATIGKRIEDIPLINLSDEDIIAINNAIDIIKKDNDVGIGLKQEIIEFLQSVKKVPTSVELEMEMEGHYYGRFIPKEVRDKKGDFINYVYSVKITNPETNTITPVNINYE